METNQKPWKPAKNMKNHETTLKNHGNQQKNMKNHETLDGGGGAGQE